MYYYIVDPQEISQKHFERMQNLLHASVASLRISGEFSRVTSLRSVRQLVDDAIMREAATVIAVGHDSTLQEVINAVGERDIAVGYIPLVNSEISKILGVADVEGACKALAQRRIETLDLGKINGSYFFTKVGIGNDLENIAPKSVFDFTKLGDAANLKPVSVKMEIDGQFNVQFEVAIGAIFNSRAVDSEEQLADPTDGVLDVLMLPGIKSLDAWKFRNELASGALEKIPGCAVIHGKRIAITSPEGLPFVIGGKTVAKAPAVIEALPNKIRMIVGKDRVF